MGVQIKNRTASTWTRQIKGGRLALLDAGEDTRLESVQRCGPEKRASNVVME